MAEDFRTAKGHFIDCESGDEWNTSLFVTGATGLNIGMFFYPLFAGIAGTESLPLLALFDLPNAIMIFTTYPAVFRFARSKQSKLVGVELENGDGDQDNAEGRGEEEAIKEDISAVPQGAVVMSKWSLLKKKVTLMWNKIPNWIRAPLTVFTAVPLDAFIIGTTLGLWCHSSLPFG